MGIVTAGWILLAGAARPAPADEVPLEDFEGAPLAERRTADGPVRAERAGKALHVVSRGRSAVSSRPGALSLNEFLRAAGP